MRWNVVLAAVVALAAAAVLVSTEAPIEDPVWWYTNSTPPKLSIEGPGGPLRGPVEANVALDPAEVTLLNVQPPAPSVVLDRSIAGAPVVSTLPFAIATTP